MSTKIHTSNVLENSEGVVMVDEKSEEKSKFVCPHCGIPLKKWSTPPTSSWGEGFHYVCFNDECSYYIRGWEWMMTQYNVSSSYRYRLDPDTGESGPVPVWSNDALKNHIVDD